MNTRALLDWYHASARDLPWRHTTDPYPIWISEIMLQQTRAAAVLDYYRRFLAAFPTPDTLAAAPLDAVLSLWQGLGYYSRARNLHRAAQIITRQGGFPETYDGLLRLPGIGDYTAAAIASAAFASPCPAVDGNVLRVLARLRDCHSPVTDPAVRREFRESLRAAFPASPDEIRVFNQAVMELGATVCVPNGPPQCPRCPLAGECLGRIRDTADTLPVRAAKSPRRVESRTVFVLVRDGRAALRRRPANGLLAGLWEFPNLPGALDESQAARTVREWGLDVIQWHSRLSAKHIFTHAEWHMEGYILTVSGPGGGEFVWLDAPELSRYAVPSAFRRYRERAAQLLDGQEQLSIPEGDAPRGL